MIHNKKTIQAPILIQGALDIEIDWMLEQL